MHTITATDLGERFARAIAAKDADTLLGLLAPDLRFHALTPGRHWEATSARAVVDEIVLGKWFSPERVVDEVLRVDGGEVGSVAHVVYRFRATLSSGPHLIEQQAYFEHVDGRVTTLHVLCSGYVSTN